MGTKERREREKRAFRNAILNAARDLAKNEGWAAVSIRHIAERIEYSPPMIYEYFEDKEALLLAIMVEGFQALHERLREARTKAESPEAALYAIAYTYHAFAHEYPELYQVMNGLEGVHFGNPAKAAKPPEIVAVIQEVIEAVTVWAASSGIADVNGVDAMHLLWATLHGLTALEMSDRISEDAAGMRRLIDSAIAAYINTWKAGKP
jgi:AcrR family transcriptional regulator